MSKKAEELGANAVVGIRFGTSMIMTGAAETMAYGTAVVVEWTPLAFAYRQLRLRRSAISSNLYDCFAIDSSRLNPHIQLANCSQLHPQLSY